jgi:ATP-dependent RNA helicase DDX10/DBP4
MDKDHGSRAMIDSSWTPMRTHVPCNSLFFRSGKTLAFLIPAFECLYRNRFTPVDGPGAIVLSPTRELAVQIFQVLKVVGKHHSFSVGLLIGGKKDFYNEQQQIGTTNIIIATPGRLLQHLEQTPYFDTGELRFLALDEADRILDLGFRDQLVRILEYLPKEQRQTLLFSATQSRDVSDLATLSLDKPEYLGVHDQEKTSTPETLQQSYVIVPIEHKLNAVYSFIKSHLKCKSIIFMATCAQVRHAYELFCSLRPGVPVMALHGKLAQEKRTPIYFDFLQRPHAVLFATDIAARGLDFPNVDWVVQVDAPEDKAMYIHRVGRTARYRSIGKSLLMLTAAEEKKGFVQLLQGNNADKLPLKKLSINPSKTVLVTQRASALVASDVNLNRLAKKAFQSYVRSIYLMPQKEIFDVIDLALKEFGEALGLASTPNLRFLKSAPQDRSQLQKAKSVNKKLQKLKEQIKAEKLAKKLQKMGKAGKEAASAVPAIDTDDESDDDLLVSKGTNKMDEMDDKDLPDAGIYEAAKSRHPKKIRVGASNSSNKHVVFTEDGDEEERNAFMKVDSEAVMDQIRKDKVGLEQATDEYQQKIRERLQSNFDQDRAQEKERIREKHKKKRLREKGALDDQAVGFTATLGGDDVDEASASGGSGSRSDSGDSDDNDSSSDDDEGMDVAAQEAMALSLIRRK